MSENMENVINRVNEMQSILDQYRLQVSQQQQIIDQYRVSIYNTELRFSLLNRMLEEKGVMAKNEFDNRWPMYLKNDIGVPGSDGIMEGNLKVTFYGEEIKK